MLPPVLHATASMVTPRIAIAHSKTLCEPRAQTHADLGRTETLTSPRHAIPWRGARATCCRALRAGHRAHPSWQCSSGATASGPASTTRKLNDLGVHQGCLRAASIMGHALEGR
eukprot:1778876-Rhodomonas_salina.5